MSQLRAYPCFDFVLRSDIALSELVETAGPTAADRIVDVRVSVGTADIAGPELAVDGDEAVLTVPGVARYRVRGTDRITVEAAPDASDRMVRLFLLGSALGIVAYRRGLMLLHANAVVLSGGAHAFAGPSGAGKSTLAAHFERAGHPILCDDVCGVSFDGGGLPLAWPGLPRLKLWRDAAEALGHDAERFDRVVEDHDKYQVPFAARTPGGPVPLRALYVLGRAEAGDGAIGRLRGAAAMAAVIENSYRHAYVAPLGLAQSHFRQCAALLAATPVFAATRRWGFDHYDVEVARIERHMEGL